MSYKLELKGLESVMVGDKLVLPFPFTEIMRMPFSVLASADDLYAHGGEINRWLLDHTPLTHSKNNVVCYAQLQYLSPSMLPVTTTDWHCDGSNTPFLANDIFHTMVCEGDGLDSDILTEFIPKDIILETDVIGIETFYHQQFRRWITINADKFGITSAKCESGKMHTWTSRHLHRVSFPTKPHFRLFWKVAESDHLIPKSKEESIRTFSKIHRGDNGPEAFSIEQKERGIIIRGVQF